MVSKVTAKKALGQNFLTDPSVAQLMVEKLNVQKGDYVIEIGAGTGAVTQQLAPICISQVAHLIAVEFDIDLIPILESKIPQNENVKIINANILNFLDDFKVPENVRLTMIGSLPYNITSPLIHRLIKNKPMPDTCVFLIQKEVAHKICMQAPDSNYFSVFVQTFYEANILKIVDKHLFNPIPQVGGAVIKLVKKPLDSNSSSLWQINDVSRYEKFLHHAFSHPRKMLNKVFTAAELEKYDFIGTNRPQDYNWKNYFKAFNK